MKTFDLEEFKRKGFYEERRVVDTDISLEGGKIVKTLRVSGKIRSLLRNPRGPTYGGDFSRQDIVVMNALIEAGLTASDAIATFAASPRGKDAAVRKEGHFPDYLRRTAAAAAAYVSQKKSLFPVVPFGPLHTGFKLSTSGHIEFVSMETVKGELPYWLWEDRICFGT